MVWVFPLKTSNFSIFCPSVKKNLFGSESTQVGGGSASYLLRFKSKLGSGQGPSLVKTQSNFSDKCFIYLILQALPRFELETLALWTKLRGSSLYKKLFL